MKNLSLIKTAHTGSVDELAAILEKGIKSKINEALTDCCSFGFLDKAELLIKHGAKATFKNSTPLRGVCVYADVIVRKFDKKTLLQLIELLLDNGADSMAAVWGDTKNVTFNNPFSWLAIMGQTSAMKLCVNKNKISKEFIEKTKGIALENLPNHNEKSLHAVKRRSAIKSSCFYLGEL